MSFLRFFLPFFFLGLGIVLGIVLMFWVLGRGPYDAPRPEKQWGITFSIPYAEQLGIPWQEAYLAMLDDLGVRELRIPAYWQIIEPARGAFDFSAIDWQIAEARKRDARVILTVGRRLPRWPECHVPVWARGLAEKEQQEEILRMLEVVVNRYRAEPVIWAWQVDNEPFVFFFGECPEADEVFFAKEVALVRRIDTLRPVIVSDSGELSLWVTAAKYADVFGTTLYRVVPSLDQKGFTTWSLPPEFYNKKANLLAKLRHPQEVIVSELQGEAWAQLKPIQDLTIEEQYASMSPDFFRDTIRYVRRTGFTKVYLWGAEWWYWLKLQGHPEIWEEAKMLFKE